MRCSKNNGFTMVEMIIVIVVLAIVTAIAIPVTLSIIDDAKEQDSKQMAKTIMNAVQTEFNKLATNDELWYSISAQKGIILNKDRQSFGKKDFTKDDFKSGFIDISQTEIATNIMKKIDNSDQINMLYVGAGNAYYYLNLDDRHKMYMAYVIVYQLKDDDEPVYFYDKKEISKEWPFLNPKVNKASSHDGLDFWLKSNPDVKLQMYSLIKKDDCGSYWQTKVMPKVLEQQ